MQSSHMSLVPGTRLGAYEVVSALGEGGMGEVYRARDTQLNRHVAIKVLPEHFALDHERLARFTREAQTLAALNHPNIAQIHGFEAGTAPGAPRALVMELVEGEDLSAIIARGAIPRDEALPIARQIAEALETAHELGIVHRDLKPANIKVRADGTVKVLDFGLAKALAAEGTSTPGDAMQSPTLTGRATQLGMIIGTAAYMAPEQAKGKPVDKRADIWAFGVVLFEMLSGRRMFAGDDTSDVLANVLKAEPDWTAIPADTPANVRRLLRRCLEKDPRKRLSAIADARLELDDHEIIAATSSTDATKGQSTMASRLWPALFGAAITAAIVAGASWVWSSGTATTDHRVTRLSVLAPPGTYLYPDSDSVAISPDGTMVAFITGSVTLSDTQLWIRQLDSMTSRRVDGGENAVLPFWSPDSRRIGFFTQTKLMTVAVSGGRAEVVTEAPNGRGASWSTSNVIVYAADSSGPIFRVAASGGTPTPVTALDSAKKEFSHRFPAFLPDGKHFLYAALPGRGGKFDISVGGLDDGSRVAIGAMDSTPVYVEPGWLLTSRQGVLAAQAFDLESLKVTGDPIQLPDEPTRVLDPSVAYTASASATVSATGILAYYSAPSTNTLAAWYDTDGRHIADLPLPAGHYEAVSISPDGGHAVVVRSTSASESALWLVNLARGGASQFSYGPGRNDTPVWSPDGTRVVFAADRDGPQDLFVKQVGDTTPEQVLYRSDALFKGPEFWSADGRWIVLSQLDPQSAQNVWVLPASGSGEPKLLVQTPNRDRGGAISPDGRWLAYASEETGRYEIYVQPFLETGQRQQISQHGGLKNWWTRDGRQLLFLGNDQRSLWRVDLEPGATLGIGIPKQIASFPHGIRSIDATPDRRRFLAIVPERVGPGSLTIVHNWQASLPAR